jgi:hypothetical protein
MRDDRDLERRLREYESRVPVDEAAPQMRERRLGGGLALSGAFAVVAVAALVAVVWMSSNRPIGDADPTPSATSEPARSSAPTASSPSEAPPSPAPSSTPAPIATPTLSPVPPTAWIGFREPLDARGAVGPSQRTPLVWASTDGVSWGRVSLGTSFTNAELHSVVAAPDGSALIYGLVTDPVEFTERRTAWRSADGSTWTEVALTVPGDVLGRVVQGGRGYVARATTGFGADAAQEVWFSSDGLTWEATSVRLVPDANDYVAIIDVAAGPEGFVVAAVYGDRSGDQLETRSMVFASGDGLEWVPARESAMRGGPDVIAALGHDWVMSATDGATRETTMWWSADGLAWEERTSVEVPAPSGVEPQSGTPIIGHIVAAGDRVLLQGLVSVCCHTPPWAAGVWSSGDAYTWERLDLPQDAYVAQAVTTGGLTVAVGHTGASSEGGWEAVATFWIGTRD